MIDDDDYKNYAKEVVGTWEVGKMEPFEVKTNNQALKDVLSEEITGFPDEGVKIVFTADGDHGTYTIKGNQITTKNEDEIANATFSI